MPSSIPDAHGPSGNTGALDAEAHGALRRGWAKARSAHPSLHVEFEAYAADVLRLWARGQRRLGLPVVAVPPAPRLGRLHHADLYLARACDHGAEVAWKVFVTTYQMGLTRIVQRHVSGANSASVVQELLADLALPPARGHEATLLGTYEGTGALWGWLATIVIRRARRERPAREVRLQDAAPAEAETRAFQADDAAEVEAFGHGLRDAWSGLEPAESLALCWKFQDGRSQREIARLLDVSAPTVTRIVQRALAKLRARLAPHATALAEGRRDIWTRFDALLSRHLAAAAAVRPPEGDEHDDA